MMILNNTFFKVVLLTMLSGQIMAQSSTSQDAVQNMEHEHSMVQIPDSVALPSISLVLSRDTKSGFNLQIETENFELEPPELANCCNEKMLEGHAHIFINGAKVYRAYSQYIHLPAELFSPGVNQIMVSLNDHEHNTWSLGSKMVMSTLVVNPSQEEYLLHRFVSSVQR